MLLDTITSNLEMEILRGDYPVGSKFPSERELASKYNVSRNTIRESITRLVHLGLLKTVPQSGTYVTDVHTNASLDLLIHIMNTRSLLDRDTLESLMEYRRLVTVFAVRKAAERINTEQLGELFLLVEKEGKNVGDFEIIADCDFRLHRQIFALAGNIALQLVFNSFKPVYRFYTDIFFKLPGAAVVTMEQHQRLLKALTAKKADLAAQIMEEALVYGEKRIMEVVEESEDFSLINKLGRD